MMKKITITMRKPMIGKNNENKVITVDVAVSTVVTNGFPTPAVETDEDRRVTPEADFMTAAVPPPAIIANAHVIIGLKSTTVETITAVPAMVANGMAIVSSKLSTKGM